ncbi:tip elongation aberrant protein 1 [Exaiptasia diaphana]|uniref:Kelch repeat-containing protein n=1 Tax=Exaiptasia diaphana TaxID=2652724 RepID=A0A913Y732_EXADI|nr:tip elongation aberrant protein 1 [Exaiptasia diaphana]
MNSLSCESPVRDNGLQIYAVLNLHETPRKLLSKDNKSNFYCHFALPLPKQVVVFAVGEWERPSGKRRKALHNSFFCKVESPKSSPKNNNLSSLFLTPSTPYSPCVKREVPSGRWGFFMCSIDDSKTVMIGGQGAKQQMVKDSLWVVSTKSGEAFFSQPSSTGSTGADRRMGHFFFYDPESKVIFVYGGSKNNFFFSDVHKLDTKTWTWSLSQTVGKAPTRAYHSCNLFFGELWVFGGVYPNPDPQPFFCSNDMYVMSLEAKNWYTLFFSSLKPLPRSGHTACLVDDRLVMFGGWDAPTCFNDLFFFDLTIMEYTQPSTTGTHPSPRSWHTAVTLPGKLFLIHGGYNGIKTLSDCFLFFFSLTWTGIKTPESLYARAGHSALLLQQGEDTQEEIVIFGGGDNLGEFFNDFTSFSPQELD